MPPRLLPSRAQVDPLLNMELPGFIIDMQLKDPSQCLVTKNDIFSMSRRHDFPLTLANYIRMTICNSDSLMPVLPRRWGPPDVKYSSLLASWIEECYPQDNNDQENILYILLKTIERGERASSLSLQLNKYHRGIKLYHRSQPSFALACLARLLFEKAHKIWCQGLAQEASSVTCAALKLSPADSFWRGDLILLRASCLALFSTISGQKSALLEAGAAFTLLVEDKAYTLRTRLEASIRWSSEARKAGWDEAALLAYQSAVGLLPLVGALPQDLKQRLQLLKLGSGLACSAATQALSMSRISVAVELLERGRGVVMTQALRLRTPVDHVPQPYRERFLNLSHASQALHVETAVAKRRRAEELEVLIDTIRALPGHCKFLVPNTFTELAAAGGKNYIVVLIPSEAHCHAVALRPNGLPPVHCMLPALDIAKLQKIMGALRTATMRARQIHGFVSRGMKVVQSEKDRIVTHEDVLLDLWDVIVAPIIELLKIEVCMIKHYSSLKQAKPI